MYLQREQTNICIILLSGPLVIDDTYTIQIVEYVVPVR